MTQVSIVKGIYSNKGAEFRQSYPINYYPSVMDTGMSDSYLRQTPGVSHFADVNGFDRGCIEFKGIHYRVCGSSFVRVYADGSVEALGRIPGTSRATLVKSADRICIVADGRGFYWSDGGGLEEITDPNFSPALDVEFVDGYFLFIDDQYIYNSDLANPLTINPLSYGSAEIEGDPNVAIVKIGNEPYVCGTETIEVFRNIGGANFPFQRVDGAVITKGVVGTHAALEVEDTLFFVGSGRGETPSVYMASGGNAQRVATSEVEKILEKYTPQELSEIVCESYMDSGHFFVLIHLKDKTLAYDILASSAAGTPLWHIRTSGEGAYRPRGFSRVYGKWVVGDAVSGRLGLLDDDTATEYGDTVLREFSTPIGFVGGSSFIVRAAYLFGLPGRTALQTNPQVFMSFSKNAGMTWSDEQLAASGRRGEFGFLPSWRRIGRSLGMMNMKFRVANNSFFTPSRLEVDVEQLNG